MLKRIALLVALAGGCAYGQAQNQMSIYTVAVPPQIAALGSTTAMYQVWIHGGNESTAAFQVSIRYLADGISGFASDVQPRMTTFPVWVTAYWSGLSVFKLPIGAVVTSVVVTQLKATDSQDFTP